MHRGGDIPQDFFTYLTMKPQPAGPEVVPYVAIKMVAIMNMRELIRLPPIRDHLLPTLSMNKTQLAWAMRAKIELMAWYLSVSCPLMPTWP